MKYISDLPCNVPVARGIYILSYLDEVVYIGMSLDNVLGRIGMHLKGDKLFDCFRCIEMAEFDDAEIQHWERKYIRHYKPTYNHTHNREIVLNKS